MTTFQDPPAPVRASRRDGGGGRRVRKTLLLVPLLFLVLWTVVPFLVTLSISLKAPTEVFTNQGLLPQQPTLDAYRDVLSRQGFRTSFANSLIVGLGTTLLTLAISVPAAYAFARYRFRGRHFLLLFTFLPRLVPSLGLMTPLY